jgi:hypothetical protein
LDVLFPDGRTTDQRLSTARAVVRHEEGGVDVRLMPLK